MIHENQLIFQPSKCDAYYIYHFPGSARYCSRHMWLLDDWYNLVTSLLTHSAKKHIPPLFAHFAFKLQSSSLRNRMSLEDSSFRSLCCLPVVMFIMSPFFVWGLLSIWNYYLIIYIFYLLNLCLHIPAKSEISCQIHYQPVLFLKIYRWTRDGHEKLTSILNLVKIW